MVARAIAVGPYAGTRAVPVAASISCMPSLPFGHASVAESGDHSGSVQDALTLTGAPPTREYSANRVFPRGE
jgi:hypothetical protein